MTEVFKGSFTQQDPIPAEGIAAATAVMQHGRLHRYNEVPGEMAEAALLEQEFAAYVGAGYALAVASGGYAICTALRAVGVKHGDPVLTNAFTLAPVPGAIAAVGGTPVYVEVTPDLVIDLDDLAAKAEQAKVLLLSHMRGHICDMDRLMQICDAAGITVVEDCAHTMGATWKGVQSGRHGAVGCYSTQTYKHINSGEGGFLVTDDGELMARAVMLSGSYMLYGKHCAGPEPEVYDQIRYETPNISGRMDNLRAAVLRPQIPLLAQRIAGWNERHNVVHDVLHGLNGVNLPQAPEAAVRVGSSFQFLLRDWAADRIEALVAACSKRGVDLKWFGADEPTAFTSRYDSWRYAPVPKLPKTDAILAGLIDMRLPLTFSLEDCALIARILREEITKAQA